MAQGQIARTVAYCGLVCGICTICEGDCRTDPKPEEIDHCYQRNCCIGKAIGGCWECDDFPCGHGYFGDDSAGWRGLNIALVQCAKEEGLEALVRLLVERHGDRTDYSEYMDKTPEEVLRMLRGADS